MLLVGLGWPQAAFLHSVAPGPAGWWGWALAAGGLCVREGPEWCPGLCHILARMRRGSGGALVEGDRKNSDMVISPLEHLERVMWLPMALQLCPVSPT